MDFYKDSYGWKVGKGYAPAGQFDLRIEQTKIYVSGLKQLANGVEVTNLTKNVAQEAYATIDEFLASTYAFFNAVVAGTSGELNTVNGKAAGTYFGDDFTVTRRVPVLAAKWSQGLPLFAVDTTFNTTGKWYLPDDANDNSYPDSVSIVESGTDPAGKCFVTSKQPNRYEPGHLSYFGYTAAFRNIENANGDFTALIGAFIRGAESLGLNNQIKDGMAWGYVRESGVTRQVFRVYKNFQLVIDNDIVFGVNLDFTKLLIFEHQIGFYGIHPSILWVFNADGKRTELFDYTAFDQDTCSIHDPNLSVGIYIENQGNTSTIEVLNGSMEYGNYTTREYLADPSGRNLPDRISVASLAVDEDFTDGSGLVAAYRVTDSFTGINSVDTNGNTTRSFQSKIENLLMSIKANGTANRAVRLNIIFVPDTDVVATFTPLRPNVNVLERALAAAITSVDYTNAQYVYSTTVTSVDHNVQVLEQIKPRLRPGTVAILVCESTASTTLTDLIVDLNTLDLF